MDLRFDVFSSVTAEDAPSPSCQLFQKEQNAEKMLGSIHRPAYATPTIELPHAGASVIPLRTELPSRRALKEA